MQESKSRSASLSEIETTMSQKDFFDSFGTYGVVGTSVAAGFGLSYLWSKFGNLFSSDSSGDKNEKKNASSNDEQKQWLDKQNELLDIANKELANAVTANDKEILRRLNCCETIIHMAKNGFLANVSKNESENDSKNDEPNCRIVQLCWKPPCGLPYIYIGTNKQSRKYNNLLNYNNNGVLTIADESGAGYVNLIGKITEKKFNDETEKWQLFPSLWKSFFVNGREKDDFTMLILNISKIELMSVRLGYNSVQHSDWKPYTIKRKGDIFDHTSKNIKWEIADDDDDVDA